MKKSMPTQDAIVRADRTSAHAPSDPRLAHLKEVIEHAAHLLPAQGPITVFIHHNTLHAFEHLPFAQAVEKGSRVFGCQPYLTEDRYREALHRGRIRFDELRAVVREDLGDRADELVACFGSRLDLRRAMLKFPLQTGPTEELLWFVAERDALRRVRSEVSSVVRGRLIAETRRWVMRDLRGGNEAIGSGRKNGKHPRQLPAELDELFDRIGDCSIENWSDADWESFTLQALWRVCLEGVKDVPSFTPPPPVPIRHRDLLLEATGVDADQLVKGLLVRFCAAYLDQGFGYWPLPEREAGFYQAFCSLYRQKAGPPARWLRGLAQELARLQDQRISPLESIRESLHILGVADHEWEPYLSATFLALRGWGGMVHQIELRGDRVAHPAKPGSTIELLAIRLVLDRLALQYGAKDALGYTGPLRTLREEALRRIGTPEPPSVEQRAFVLFQLAQVLGVPADVLHRLDKQQWASVLREVETFSGIERRRVFHLAYERRFVTQTLDAVALHAHGYVPTPTRPRFQASFCLDDREESIRRHLEEIAPDCETFGIAGFYNVAMYYRGAADAHFVPLCPVVIRPQHWVTEQVAQSLEEEHRRRAKARRALGTASHQFHVGSRSFAVGAVLTAAFGALATFPLVARILFPRFAARIRQLFGSVFAAPPETRLQIERSDPAPGPENGHLGYTVDEMASIAERTLRDLGLTRTFARLVILHGHGSSSLNNPHKSAYDCGACGGSPGAPNGRAMAHLLNDPRIRARLGERGLPIPDTTHFIGGYHNTCNDTITLFDLDRVPETHRAELDAVRRDLDAACARNAHERSRRFLSAPLTMSFEDARLHVEERAEDLSQTRPELGHATNTICIVGKRDWTRGLFLDRRAFLTSYDPVQDDAEQTILTRLLDAVFPVCAGINLEYYFSYVDNYGFGCGSKLPHNVSGLVGVMDGAASDLRTGLPWQMVEIHEPVRLVMIIETTPDAMLRIMERSEVVGRLCRNEWVLLTVITPDTHEIKVYRNGVFEDYQPQANSLPRAASSVDWYRGWRDHLEFAAIVGPAPTGATTP
jgi:uncharacterized protein YbcC (UPF0753/DUF2309 family)